MIAVILEVTPRIGKRQAYFNLATEMRPLLEGIDGFISIERFQSLAEPRRILSLSFWRDEAAVEEWHDLDLNRRCQAAGRRHIFETYRLRTAGVIGDCDMHDRGATKDDAPRSGGRSRAFAAIRGGQAPALVAT